VTHAILIRQVGGPETLKWEEIEVAPPGPREVLIRHQAVGVNFADVYMRSGNHPAPLKFPAILGVEGAGTIEQAGAEVRDFAVGDRVAYFGVLGAYAETRIVPAERLIRLPPLVTTATAAAILTKGITARYLCRQAYPVGPGDVVLVHAAAGGVGTILAQLSAAQGAEVIGTVGSDRKVDAARRNGCRDVIILEREQLAPRLFAITDGRKATVVFDSMGGDYTLASLDCLRPRGTLVTYGRTTGYPHAITPFQDLMQKGSLKVTMTQLVDFVRDRADIDEAAADLFAAVEKGQLVAAIGQSYPLRDAAQAHRDLEARKTVGSVVLLA
jgi:NADPH2:quinone reductase